MEGLFVTGTGTGVGKTVLSASLLAAIAASGKPVRAHKPVLTGLEDESEVGQAGRWPADHELLALAASMAPEDVAPLRYHPAVSPHLAAELAGERLDPAQLLAAARGEAYVAAAPGSSQTTSASATTPSQERLLIVEGVGGLLVPLVEDYTVCDLAVQLALPLLIAASPGLGTINHTLLTLHAARAAGLEVCAVVLTPWPEHPCVMERSNRETIARLGAVEVGVLPYLPRPNLRALARAGASLPWERWLSSAQ